MLRPKPKIWSVWPYVLYLKHDFSLSEKCIFELWPFLVENCKYKIDQ